MERRRIMSERILTPLLFTLLMFAQHSEQYSSGAPPKACEKMLPIHQGGIKPQTSKSPFDIRAWAPQVHQGQTLNVTIYGTASVPFQGFFVQARSVQDNSRILGTWTPNPDGTSKTTECNAPGDSITHTSKAEKTSIVLRWKAPTDFLGAVVIRATVAQDYATFWGGIDATLVEVVHPDTVITALPVPDTTVASRPTPPIVFPTTAKNVAVKNNAFYDGCGSTKLCFGKPSPQCITDQNCDAAVTVLVEGDVYTFEVTATGSPGFVAAGLSSDKLMGDDSAMECTQVNGRVSVHASWTYPKSGPYVSRENVSQRILQPVSSSYTDGVLTCKFTRDVRSVVRGQTFDLSQDKYHLMIVAGEKAEEASVGFHDKVFDSSEDMISLTDPIIVGGASKLLLRLHGAFMLVAWIGTASCGILLARYYRQTWVGSQLGGKDIWFAWHRIFMVLTWLLTMAAFIIILVEVKGWTGTGENPHAIIGIVTVILCFLQPIGAYFRPHPNTAKRPIFNWVHWFLGNSAHILGIVTIFFAVYLKKAELPGWMIYILVAFVAFHVIVHLILSIAMCVSDGRINNGRVNSFPMKDFLSSNRASVNHDRKIDAQHSGFRKLILGVYFTIIILFVVALVCLISLAPIESTIDSVSKAISGAMENDKN